MQCDLSTCPSEVSPARGQKVRALIRGAEYVGMACTQAHAVALAQQWSTGDRYSPASSVWGDVGNGRVAA